MSAAVGWAGGADLQRDVLARDANRRLEETGQTTFGVGARPWYVAGKINTIIARLQPGLNRTRRTRLDCDELCPDAKPLSDARSAANASRSGGDLFVRELAGCARQAAGTRRQPCQIFANKPFQLVTHPRHAARCAQEIISAR